MLATGADLFMALFAIPFAGPGVFMLVRFVPRLIHQRRYGEVYLKPSQIPLSPADRFEAVLHTGADTSRFSPSNIQFDLRLTCNQFTERSTASGRTGPRFVRRVLWEQRGTLFAATGASRSGSVIIARISVDLAADQPATSPLPGREFFDWRLEVTAPAGLPRFRYEFRLPVYDTRTAREKADEALGPAPRTAGMGDSRAITPVPKADLPALREYGRAVQESRHAEDPRPIGGRLIRSLKPHTYLARHDGQSSKLNLVHVRGDRQVRNLRRFLALFLVAGAVILSAPMTPVLLLGALLLHFMGKAARPVMIAVHADAEGLQVDTVDGRKERSHHYDWSEIGRITDTQFSVFYSDIMVPRPKRTVATLGVRLPSKREAQGIAAAIAAVKSA